MRMDLIRHAARTPPMQCHRDIQEIGRSHVEFRPGRPLAFELPTASEFFGASQTILIVARASGPGAPEAPPGVDTKPCRVTSSGLAIPTSSASFIGGVGHHDSDPGLGADVCDSPQGRTYSKSRNCRRQLTRRANGHNAPPLGLRVRTFHGESAGGRGRHATSSSAARRRGSRSPTICRNMRNTRRRAKTSADRDAASGRHGHATGRGRRSGLNRVPQEPSLLVPGYLGKWRSPRRKISPRRQWRVAAGSPGSCHRGSPNFLAPPPPAVPYPSANVATPKQEAT
jgi:hypothetical protein